MRVILFGATGMVGQGVLRECLLDSGVEAVLSVGRTALGVSHPKLSELVVADLFALEPIEGFDACFFCLGVSSVGMKEADYRRVTYDLTLSIAAKLPEDLTFVYVSGEGTDAEGRSMWARVKGATENALLAMPFRAYMFRPGYIQPLHGVRSKTRWYRVAYVAVAPVYPLLRRLFPATTTEQIGRAMLSVARYGSAKRVLQTRDINAIAPS